MQVPHTTFPALLGDGQNRYRVHIVGNSVKLQEEKKNYYLHLVETSEPFQLFNFAGSGPRQVCFLPLDGNVADDQESRR